MGHNGVIRKNYALYAYVFLYVLWHVDALPGNGSINTPQYEHETIGRMFLARW
jgi:hypothetical protein